MVPWVCSQPPPAPAPHSPHPLPCPAVSLWVQASFDKDQDLFSGNTATTPLPRSLAARAISSLKCL